MTHTSRIAETLVDSVAGPVEPAFRRDAPNVVVIVLDDLGFAQLGCYGSDLETPNLDRLAARGVRFTNFHTTAMCSPTRACLLTGRNHHRVGMGMLPDIPTNFAGYTGEFPRDAGTLAQILQADGYATTAIGKWHLTPRDQRATGPFHMWPTSLGFDRYYGFLNGETNWWTPNLVRDQSHVEPPRSPDEGYHIDADLADEAIRQLRDLHLHQPERPFLLWYATGTPHAPHQAPQEWIDRFAGRFDAGWDVWREEVFARQVELGIVPEGTTMSPRPPWVEAWDDLDADRRRLYARMMEVFAGFVAHCDHHIGRVLDELEHLGAADDTVVVLLSDNGCSAEGGPDGSWNQLSNYMGEEGADIAEELAHIDDLGGIRSAGHYPWGWAFAGNTPFRRWKRYTFEGGVRDPFIVSWPGGLTDAGALRDQYVHAVDVMPTILDLVGVEVPDELGGIAQSAIDGTTIRPVLDDAEAPDTRTEQYYELWGSRAMYVDGWKVVTDHVNQLTAAEVHHLEGSSDFVDDTWHLFDTRNDPTESVDLAAQHPEKLEELKQRWYEEAERNGVFPLDDSRDNRFAHIRMPWYDLPVTRTFHPGDKVHEANGPMLAGSFRLVAAFDHAGDGLRGDESGVLCEQGDWMAGWAWYLRSGLATWVYVWNGTEHRVEAKIPTGTRSLEIAVSAALDGRFDVVLSAAGAELDRSELPEAMTMAITPDGAFLTVGYGRPFPVTEDYAPPFPAPASLVAVRYDLGAPAPIDVEELVARAIRHQ